MPEFEWDENKRVNNLQKHRLDFVRAKLLFHGRPTLTFKTPRDGEERSATTGYLDGEFVTAIWTQRGEFVRLISVRRARHDERRAYRSVYGSRD